MYSRQQSNLSQFKIHMEQVSGPYYVHPVLNVCMHMQSSMYGDDFKTLLFCLPENSGFLLSQ